MPNPIEFARDFCVTDAANLPAGTTYGTDAPVAVSVLHVQYAWDGTPSDADNREDVAIRFTVWAPRGKPTTASTHAAGLRRRILGYGSALSWRVDRGAGRLPGVDPDTGLPFCTFTVNAALHAA